MALIVYDDDFMLRRTGKDLTTVQIDAGFALQCSVLGQWFTELSMFIF